MTKPCDEETRDDNKHQERLLPFMMISLIVMGLLFFIATIWQFQDLQSRLKSTPPNIEQILERLSQNENTRSDKEYRDWYVRSVLENAALTNRYRQNSAMIHARVWTRYMGFLTGMVLALSGCVFILGRLREKVDTSVQTQDLKATLNTSSPGIFLSAVGAILIGISISVKVSVETHDQAVYLPQTVKVLQTEEQPNKPVDLKPQSLDQEKQKPKAGTTLTLPATVIEKMREQSKTEK